MNSFVILLASFITFFRTINTFPLRNWDEAWYAEIIKNMASGNYSLLVPFWNGQYYFDKPPLYFWLSLPFFKIFGPGEWQTRIISSLAATFASFLVYLIGKKLFGKTAGFISFLVFLTLGQVVFRFAHGNLDALLAFFILLSFYFYLNSQKKPIFSIICGISIGLGFLIKGYFIGLYTPLIIAAYSFFTQKRLPKNWLLIAAFSFISSSWYYIAGSIIFKNEFSNWYILNPSGGLLTSSSKSFSLTYFQDLARDVGFWFLLVIISRVMIRKIPKKVLKIIAAFGVSIIALIFPLNFLSEKLGWYNLPAYPLVALIIGFFAQQLFKKSLRITILLMTTLAVFQIYNIIRIENIYPDKSKIGATLGLHAQKIIPQDSLVILDDHDFTSFLYYSNLKAVYVIEKNGGKKGEWWVKKYEDLHNIASTHTNTWIITPNSQKINDYLGNGKVIEKINNYAIIKYNNN